MKTIIAQKGKIVPDPEGKALILDLRNGSILREDQNGDPTGSGAFEGFVFRFTLDRAATQGASETLKRKPISKIREEVQIAAEKRITGEGTGYEADYFRRVALMGRILITQRFTHPLACLALAVIAFPAGAAQSG